MHHYLPGKIIKIEHITPLVKLFFWKADLPVPYLYKPGQFAIIHFPEIQSTMPHRSYSIAGVADNVVEFCISYKKEGAATGLLWEKKEGDSLSITEAKGEFVLQHPIPEELCFIATGTGIAPFKPMILALLKANPQHKIHLIFGNRTQSDIIYHHLWQKLALEHLNFKYTPTLSRENWNGKSGYVHPIYMDIFAHAPEAHFYLCGWNEMLKEARRNLKSLGYNRKQYFIESYN